MRHFFARRRKVASRHRDSSPQATLQLDRLEERLVPAVAGWDATAALVDGAASAVAADGAEVATLDGTGCLCIQGTDSGDRISLSIDGENVIVTVNDDTTSFSASQVQTIDIHAADGDDRVLLEPGVVQATTIYGGAGNDTLIAGSGADRIIGGAGDDTLVALDEMANDQLTGNEGCDAFWIDRNEPLQDLISDQEVGDEVLAVSEFVNGVDRTLDGDEIADPAPSYPDAPVTDFRDCPLFAEAGPSAADVFQGSAGDCPVVASMASVAHQNPLTIRQAMADFGDGTYGVRMGEDLYRVDADLYAQPYDLSDPLYAGLGQDDSLWAALFEKTIISYFVRANGGDETYGRLGGIDGQHVLEAFGASDNDRLESSDFATEDAWLDAVYEKWSDGESVSAGVSTTDDVPLVGSHVYTLISMNRQASEHVPSITLRNPWGFDGPTTPWDTDPNDGLVTVTRAQFLEAVHRCDFGHVRKSAEVYSGITISSAAGLIVNESGQADVLLVVLDFQPTANVVIQLENTSPHNYSLSRTQLTFAFNNWDDPQTVVVSALQDVLIEGEAVYPIIIHPVESDDPAYYAHRVANPSVVVLDDDSGQVAGHVWLEQNHDGQQTSGELDAAGFGVYVDLNDNNSLDSDEPSATCDLAGDYHLDVVPVGTYSVRTVTSGSEAVVFPTQGEHVATITPGQAVQADFAIGLDTTASILVDTLVDESDGDYSAGDLSLRESIGLAANEDVYPGIDVIAFSPTLNLDSSPGVISLGSQLPIFASLVIAGPGSANLTIDANETSRVFSITNSDERLNVTLAGLTITGGAVTSMLDGIGCGGGVRSTENTALIDCHIWGNSAINSGGGIINSYGSMRVFNSIIVENESPWGAGLNNYGTLTIRDSMIQGNSGTGIRHNTGTATVIGSVVSGNSETGIRNVGSMSIVHSTIAGNGGNGLYTFPGYRTDLANSIVTLNSITDVSGWSAGSPNLIGVDPHFVRDPGAYGTGDYGDLRLEATSPAVDAGDNALAVDACGLALTVDLAGNARIRNGVVDMGAYEFQSTAGPEFVGSHRGHTWYLDADGSQAWNIPGDTYFSFGIPGDGLIVGDWDGDGYDKVGVHRGDMWYLDYDGNGQWNLPSDQYFRFGIVGDEPVIGDWDGDGADEVGVHRGSAWYLDTDCSHSWTAGDQYFRFGIPGDDPLVGDWDGDGTDEIGVHRGDTWFLDTDGSHAWNAGDEHFHFGIPGDEPLVGDWNADGTDEVGVHRGDRWYLDTDGSRAWNVPGDEYFRFGIPGDEAVVGRWQSAGGGGGQAGGGQASFASAMPEPPAEPETALLVGLLSTNASTADNTTPVDSIFAAEPAALPSAAESDTELPIDAISSQVTRSSRLGSGGLLDLPTANVHDQVLEELLQSIWWLSPNEPALA